MKKGWRTESLGELCDVLDHKRKPITKCDRVAGDYPYYGATGVLGHVEGYIFDEPLVLVGEDGAKWESGAHTAFAVGGKIWVNNHAHVLRPHRNEILDNWLIYFLNHSDLSVFVSGLTVPKLNQGNLREIPIPLAPLAEQQRIVGLLDEAFEGIATAKANAEKNLQNARALFESHLQSVFSQRGEGWVEKRIEEWCDSIMDCVNKTAPVVDGPTPFKMIRTTNVRHGRVDVSSVKYVTEETYKVWTRRQTPQKGDVILTREAPMGEVGMLLTDDKVFLGQRLVSYRVNSTKLDNHFLLFALQSGDLQGQIHAKASGSTVQHMRVPDTKNLLLAAPPLAKQREVVAQLSSLRAETQRLTSLYTRKLAALEALKKSLLHQAFSGEL
jgi:type I restriction enzyme S subunit